jgi:hypothetical protein
MGISGSCSQVGTEETKVTCPYLYVTVSNRVIAYSKSAGTSGSVETYREASAAFQNVGTTGVSMVHSARYGNIALPVFEWE